jgi:asparagine synthase (glutamine-hydrolysing)
MCGICGIVQLGTPPREVISRETLARMTDVMTPRGPNDRGFFVEDGVALGVRRLSIIDLEGGHQPVPNENETVWAVQNGELYNHDSVRARLVDDGHRFRSRCDTEILPHLYEQVRDDAPAHVRGDFGFAVWDSVRRRALVARDRLGVKPLYYAVAGDRVVFASELKSVLASGLVDPELDVEAIDVYLTLGFFPYPLTPLKQVRKLAPGHRLIVDGDVRVEPYWSFPHPEPDRTLTEAAAAEALLAELDDAVRVRLMSDVPLGAMLSGGLDSSLLVALMARNLSEPVRTFSVGFVEDAGSELREAKLVAERVGAEHHELRLSMNETAIELEDLVWALDEPVADLSALGFMALSELAARHVTVAIAGQGSDELFGGYSRHWRARLVERSRSFPAPLVGAAARALQLAGGRYERFGDALRARDAVTRFLALRSPSLGEKLRREIVLDGLGRGDVRAHRIVDGRAAGLVDNPLDAALYLDAQLGLVDDMLHYTDRVSMAHSLEIRVPFLDHHVVELAARIPSGFKVRGRTTKHLVKRAARGILPHEIIDKPKTGFFSSALEAWLRAQLDTRTADVLLAPEPAFGRFLDPRGVRRLVAEQRSGANSLGDALYAILVLEVWLSSFLGRALPRPSARERVLA